MKTVNLTEEQFDKVEEAADILSMSFNCCDSMAGAIEMISDFFIRSVGPLYESEIFPGEEDDIPVQGPERL